MLTLLLLATAAVTPQAPAARALEIFPMAQLRQLHPHDEPPIRTLLPNPDQIGEWRRNLLGNEDDQEEDPSLLYLQMAHAKAVENGDLSWSLEQQQLFVTAAPAQLAELRDELVALRAAIDRPIAITVELYEAKELAEPPAIVAAGATDATGRGTLLWRDTSTTTSGHIAIFDAMRWSRYVHGVNVEVAQKSSISAPVLGVFGEGIGGAVAAHALAGSEDLVLLAQFLCGQRRRIDSTATGVVGQPQIDLPWLDTAFATGSARVPAGSAMQIVLSGDAASGPRFVLVLTPRWPEPRVALPGHEVQLLPISALTTSALNQRLRWPDSMPELADQPASWNSDDTETGVSSDRIVEIVRQAVGSETVELECRNGQLLVHGDAAAQQAALAALEQLQDRLLVTTTLTASADLDEVVGTTPFAAAAASKHPARQHQIVVPTLAGRWSIAFRGSERTAIRTMLPEIAQEASVNHPYVEARPSGLWLECRTANPLAGNAIDLELQLDHSDAPPVRSLGSTGAMHLADTDSLRAHRIVQLAPDAEVTVGTGTCIEVDGRPVRPSLHVRRSSPPSSPDHR